MTSRTQPTATRCAPIKENTTSAAPIASADAPVYGDCPPAAEQDNNPPNIGWAHFNKYVLVVDDDVFALDEMAETFRDFGLTPLLATNPAQAFEKAMEYKPRFVVIDFCLPQMNGLDVIDKLRTLLPKTKYFMISGDKIFSRVANPGNTNVLGIIKKPASVAEIARFIRTSAEIYASVAGTDKK